MWSADLGFQTRAPRQERIFPAIGSSSSVYRTCNKRPLEARGCCFINKLPPAAFAAHTSMHLRRGEKVEQAHTPLDQRHMPLVNLFPTRFHTWHTDLAHTLRQWPWRLPTPLRRRMQPPSPPQ